ncbi:MAG TPA: class F sortase [Candidatus Saccharimonadales bacterium]|nr:class F sortase [Candidatus Saccharimonadales bacterium]
MKAIQRIGIFLYILLIVYITQQQFEKIFQMQKIQEKASIMKVQKKFQLFPMRLIISKIHVNAKVDQLGLTATGAMEVPKNTIDAGWFKYGVQPGSIGSSVIAGHFDGENGTAGVFANLNKLRKGDSITIEYANGASYVFIVVQSRIFNLGYADDVFRGANSARLNLITCDGVWNGAIKSYTKRLVVFADILK